MTKQKPLVLHVFPSFEVGGSQRRMVTYLNKSDAQLDHQVYAMDGCYDAAELIPSFRRADIPDNAIPKGSIWKAVRAAKKELAQLNPTLLVCYNWGGIEWALAGASSIPTIHIQDGFAEDEQTAEKTLRRLMRRYAYGRCAKVIVPSKTLEQIARESWRIKSEKLAYIPNGIDLELFDGSADQGFMAQFGLTADHTLIGTVARLKPEKNIGRMIEAFSLLQDDFPNTRLVIVGDGMAVSALKMLAGRICQPERVVFTGNISEPERIVPAFDIFALSSDTEQMPISVLEAMAASKPIVSTDVGDVKNMVSEPNVSYVASKKAETLAENLGNLLADPDLGRYLGKKNRELVEAKFSETAMIQEYDQIFADCAGL